MRVGYWIVCFTARPGSEKDITEVSGTSSPGSIPGRGNFLAATAAYFFVKAKCFSIFALTSLMWLQ